MQAEFTPDLRIAAEPIALRIVYEDEVLLVIDKPAGMVVHPGAGNPAHTLQNALLAHDPALARVPRAGLIHRLDKDTSGLLVVARTPEQPPRAGDDAAAPGNPARLPGPVPGPAHGRRHDR